MLQLNEISPNKGSRSSRKRLGRGPGSGLGQTSGKGEKGQLARSGGTSRPGFEGGQMPLYRRIPKRGFKSESRLERFEASLGLLSKVAEGGVDTVSLSVLKELGVAPRKARILVVLGGGSLTRKVDVSAARISASARASIEKFGGKALIGS